MSEVQLSPSIITEIDLKSGSQKIDKKCIENNIMTNNVNGLRATGVVGTLTYKIVFIYIRV